MNRRTTPTENRATIPPSSFVPLPSGIRTNPIIISSPAQNGVRHKMMRTDAETKQKTSQSLEWVENIPLPNVRAKYESLAAELRYKESKMLKTICSMRTSHLYDNKANTLMTEAHIVLSIPQHPINSSCTKYDLIRASRCTARKLQWMQQLFVEIQSFLNGK
jgi:hypothetical protein